jgi:hypothetical protein
MNPEARYGAILPMAGRYASRVPGPSARDGNDPGHNGRGRRFRDIEQYTHRRAGPSNWERWEGFVFLIFGGISRFWGDGSASSSTTTASTTVRSSALIALTALVALTTLMALTALIALDNHG